MAKIFNDLKKSKKGFTLIELLAVILILGIIALIAIPTVNNIINEAKRGSFKTTVQNITKAVEEQCQVERLRGDTQTSTYTFSNAGVSPSLGIKGKLPIGGTITVDNDCNATINNVTDGKYRASKSSTSENLVIAEVGEKVCSATTGDGTHIGDVITCGTESFYVYDTTGDSIKMFSKYNLKVGGWYNNLDVNDYHPEYYTPYSESEMTYMQDANMRGWVEDQTEWKGTTAFSSEEKHGEEYSSYEGSIVEEYVDRYKEILIGMGVTVQDARLISYEELVALGCNEDEYWCDPEHEGTAPEWVYSTTYWSGSSYAYYNVWGVSSVGYFFDDYCDYDCDVGVRPVVIISKSEI